MRGVARLISSARSTSEKTGPGRNSNSTDFWLRTLNPVMSLGRRSGVHCTRPNFAPGGHRQTFGERGFSEARFVFDQQVSASEQADEDQLDHVLLAAQEAVEEVAERGNGGDGHGDGNVRLEGERWGRGVLVVRGMGAYESPEDGIEVAGRQRCPRWRRDAAGGCRWGWSCGGDYRTREVGEACACAEGDDARRQSGAMSVMGCRFARCVRGRIGSSRHAGQNRRAVRARRRSSA